mgnify:CR=1 FL=1
MSAAQVSYERFCADAAARWDTLEALLDDMARGEVVGFDGLERVVALQHAALTDLALARASFPRSAATRRLRTLVVRARRVLQPPPAPWTHRLRDALRSWPAHVRAEAGPMLVATLVFLAAGGLGAVLSSASEAPALLFVGEEAVAAMRNGEIWTDSVGDQMPAPLLAAAIAANNAGVGLLAWASGALLGLGSLYVLLTNGLMVGCFVTLAAQHGLLDRLFAFIAAHGPLELTLIVLCGAAGLALTRGLLTDDGRPLEQRAADAGRRSFLIVAGTMPGFALLGIVEGFISPDMGVPTVHKALLGLALWLVFGLAVVATPAPDNG